MSTCSAKPVLLKFLLSDYKRASRDRREMQAALAVGFDVVVYGKGEKSRKIEFGKVLLKEEPTVKRFKIKQVNHLASFLTRLKTLRLMSPDVLSCHDLVALGLGWASMLGSASKPALIYDAHELETARNVGGGSRGRLATWVVSRLEGFLMQKCAFSIAVNDSIADEMHRLHPRCSRPVVVRSTPPLWERDGEAVVAHRSELCDALGADPERSFLVMYHGGVCEGRGVEQIIRLVGELGDQDVYAVVMGDGYSQYMESLRSLADEIAPGRVLFRPAVPREGLEAWVAAADLEMVILENICMNHYYTLPNKFFEAVQAEVPIVASDFPETGRLVREYGIGLTCDPVDMGGLVSAVRRMRDDGEFYAECKANLSRAKEELCWERERAGLEEAYKGLIDSYGERRFA